MTRIPAQRFIKRSCRISCRSLPRISRQTEVLDLLEENRDARGEAKWKEIGDRAGGLTSFGIGLTKLRTEREPRWSIGGSVLGLWK